MKRVKMVKCYELWRFVENWGKVFFWNGVRLNPFVALTELSIARFFKLNVAAESQEKINIKSSWHLYYGKCLLHHMNI